MKGPNLMPLIAMLVFAVVVCVEVIAMRVATLMPTEPVHVIVVTPTATVQP